MRTIGFRSVRYGIGLDRTGTVLNQSVSVFISTVPNQSVPVFIGTVPNQSVPVPVIPKIKFGKYRYRYRYRFTVGITEIPTVIPNFILYYQNYEIFVSNYYIFTYLHFIIPLNANLLFYYYYSIFITKKSLKLLAIAKNLNGTNALNRSLHVWYLLLI
jgi:hypothetical protein